MLRAHYVPRVLACVLPITLYAACSDSGGSDAGTNNNNNNNNTTDAATGGSDATTGGSDATTGGMDATTSPDSGNGNAPTCDPGFGAGPECGGDLTGSWTYRGACGSTDVEDGVRQACPGATFQATSHDVTGSLEFNGNNYTVDVTDTADVNMTIPTVCATPLGGCAGVQATLTQQLGRPTTCTTSPQGCDCTTQTTAAAAETGTYTTSAGTLTTMPSGGGTNTYYYCVSNGEFRYREQGTGIVYVLTP
jgi:hypothetical protein